MNTDPTGEDIYSVDDEGNFSLLEQLPTKEVDEIRSFLGEALQVQKTFMKYEMNTYATIKSPTYGESQGKISVYSVSYKRAKKIIKFLRNATRVEWTVAYMKEDSKKIRKDGKRKPKIISMIGTSHDPDRDATIGFIIEYALKHDFKVLRIDHYHDDGNTQISFGDVSVAEQVHKYFPNCLLYICFPNSDDKIPYDENSEVGVLPELEVVKP
ncbi:MAG: hypothetical protein HDS75_02185 [Bacteroidales bacterium]|nr:hypothetical protein [Bacteroidales bacterium]